MEIISSMKICDFQICPFVTKLWDDNNKMTTAKVKATAIRCYVFHIQYGYRIPTRIRNIFNEGK